LEVFILGLFVCLLWDFCESNKVLRHSKNAFNIHYF